MDQDYYADWHDRHDWHDGHDWDWYADCDRDIYRVPVVLFCLRCGIIRDARLPIIHPRKESTDDETK